MERPLMSRRTFARRPALFLWLGFACCIGSAPLQTARAQTRPAILEAQTEVTRLLAQGEEFERARRWGEALGHYETAIKQFPDRAELKERLILARMHFDVARRYADTSFNRSIEEMTTAEALELYGEVLLKLQTHYVDAPNWQTL